jgi:predicted nucleic acid-binding protein
MRYLLDTNVLLRLAESGHAGHRAAVQAVERLERRGDDLLIVPQILYEFWSVATRPTATAWK